MTTMLLPFRLQLEDMVQEVVGYAIQKIQQPLLYGLHLKKISFIQLALKVINKRKYNIYVTPYLICVLFTYAIKATSLKSYFSLWRKIT